MNWLFWIVMPPLLLTCLWILADIGRPPPGGYSGGPIPRDKDGNPLPPPIPRAWRKEPE